MTGCKERIGNIAKNYLINKLKVGYIELRRYVLQVVPIITVPPGYLHKYTPIMSRLIKEYKIINAQDDILLFPENTDNLNKWIAIITGPQNTPYEGQDFKLHISIPDSYPNSPPIVKFEKNSMPHVNVNYESGEICLDILKGQWSPVYNLLYTVQSIERLLSEPNADSPLNLELGILMREGDKTAYDCLIRYYLQIQV